jgi:hypothetical protein
MARPSATTSSRAARTSCRRTATMPCSGVTSNGMSQSRIGLQGKEPLHFMDWSGVFKVETYFNPASGQITDALKSVTQNNGRCARRRARTSIRASPGSRSSKRSSASVLPLGERSPSAARTRRSPTSLPNTIRSRPRMPSRCSACPAHRPAAATRRIGASTVRSNTTAISSTWCTSARCTKRKAHRRRAMPRRHRRGVLRVRGVDGCGVRGRVRRCVLHQDARCGFGGYGLSAAQVADLAGVGPVFAELGLRHDLGQCLLRSHGLVRPCPGAPGASP